MIKEFEKLTRQDQNLLLNGPVLVSVLAASAAGEIPDYEKADAIKLVHLKTYTADPLLIPYYQEVDKHFKENFELMAKKYAPFNAEKRALLQKEVIALNAAIAKLETAFASTLHTSLLGYAEHVKKAYKGLVVNFLFPFPIPDLTE